MASWDLGGVVNATGAHCGPWPADPLNYIYSGPYPMPTARQALGGNFPIYIHDVALGYSSGPLTDVTIGYQSVNTGGGTLFANSGGTADLYAFFTGGGTLYVGRNTGNGLNTTCARTGSVIGAGGMSGTVSWAQVPTMPGSISAVPGVASGTVQVTISGSSDSGDSTIFGYDIQSATSLAGPWTTRASTSVAVNQIAMPPGDYYFRVYANNAVGSSQARATASTVRPTGGGRRYNGSTFTPLTVAKRYSGLAWVDLVTRKRWDGSAWVDIVN